MYIYSLLALYSLLFLRSRLVFNIMPSKRARAAGRLWGKKKDAYDIDSDSPLLVLAFLRWLTLVPF